MSTAPFSTSSIDEATQSALSRSRSSSTEGGSEGEVERASKEKASSSPSSSDIEILADPADEQVSLSKLRKIIILGVFCSAQFFDLFNANAVIVSLPSVSSSITRSNFTLVPPLNHLSARCGSELHARSPAMDTLSVHPHLRLLHADLRHPFRYISPETDILSGLRLFGLVQHPCSCERPPDYGHRV